MTSFSRSIFYPKRRYQNRDKKFRVLTGFDEKSRIFTKTCQNSELFDTVLIPPLGIKDRVRKTGHDGSEVLDGFGKIL